MNKAGENHGRGGQNVAENFAVRASDILPQRAIAHEHARAHDMARLGACCTQCIDDDVETAFRLRIRIAGRDDVAIFTNRRGT